MTAAIEQSEVLCTLKAIQNQLEKMNKFIPQINVIAENMNKIMNVEKIPKDTTRNENVPNSEISSTSLNWTCEKNKWITPPKTDIEVVNAHTNNIVTHSTPVSQDTEWNYMIF